MVHLLAVRPHVGAAREVHGSGYEAGARRVVFEDSVGRLQVQPPGALGFRI